MEPTKSATVTLDDPIVRGEETITELSLRQPKAGELRGLNMLEVGQLNVDAMIKLIPRIASPMINEIEVAAMSPADLLACGVEIGNFLLQKSANSAFRA